MATKIERLLSIHDVREITGRSRATIHRWIKEGRFPKPHKVSAASNVWPESEIAAWQDQIMGRTVA